MNRYEDNFKLIIAFLAGGIFALLVTMLVDSTEAKTIEVPIRDTIYIEMEEVDNPIMDAFKKYEGTPYLYGGVDENGMDCSGFVYRVHLEAFGMELPRSTSLLFRFGSHQEVPAYGDLVFFSPTEDYDHVGIYVGEGNFIHSSSSKGVMMSNINDDYWKECFREFRRVR